MNVYDQAHSLAAAIKASEEFKQYDQSKKTVEASFNFTLTAPKSAEDVIKETAYSNLTKSQKLNIIYWIEARYEYYDNVAGGYSGDKYTETIFNEAAGRYNKTYEQIDSIWKQKL